MASNPTLLKMLKEMDVPICVARIGIISFPENNGEDIFPFAEICKNMVKTLSIENNKVFVGENPMDMNTALIEYEKNDKNPMDKEFFDRYAITKMMLLEFEVFNPVNGKISFCVKGLWDKDTWKKLIIDKTSNFEFISMQNMLS
jgi:hypothetical protein